MLLRRKEGKKRKEKRIKSFINVPEGFFLFDANEIF